MFHNLGMDDLGHTSWVYDLLLRAAVHCHEQQAYSKQHVSGNLFYPIIL